MLEYKKYDIGYGRKLAPIIGTPKDWGMPEDITGKWQSLMWGSKWPSVKRKPSKKRR